MRTPIRPRLMLACLAIAAVAMSGCGGHSHTTTTPQRAPHTNVRVEGNVAVQSLTVHGANGVRIPALLAMPRSGLVRGCLIWQFGAGSTKEDSSRVWPGAAQLGLATFSIDFRDHGSRSSATQPLPDALQSAPAIAGIVRGSVSDLHKSIDYLESRPYCRHNIAYAGVSLGGIVGSILAAEDHRIRAVVLMATPASWRTLISTDSVLSSLRAHPATERGAVNTLSPLDPLRFVGGIAPRPLLIVSGRQDDIVPIWSGQQLQLAAGQPHSVYDYNGGHDPLAGPSGPSTAEVISSFLLTHIVEPTFGVSGGPSGTYWQPSG